MAKPITYHLLMHCKNNASGPLANVGCFAGEGATQDKKIRKWTHELVTGVDQSKKKYTPIITHTSVIVNICNHHYNTIRKSLLGRVFSILSKDTHFKSPLTVFPADLD